MRFKSVAGGLVVSLLALGLVGCDSDPYKNAGRCEKIGDVREIDGQVQACIGLKGKLKWYISGKYFDDYKLLSKVVYTSDDGDLGSPEIQESGLFKYAIQFERMNIHGEDIAAYADGDTRWDGLIEALANLNREQIIQNFLLQERSNTLLQWKQGKISEQKAYEAQQAQIEQGDGDLAAAETVFYQKLAVLKADIVHKYGITDLQKAIIFGLTILKNQDSRK